MLKNTIRIAIVLLSVLAVFQLRRRSFVKYLPTGLFSVVLSLTRMFYFTNRKKLQVPGGPRALNCTALLVVLGPQFIVTLLTFRLAKGRFMIYSFITAISNALYTYFIAYLFERLNFMKFRISKNQFYMISMMHSLLNYLFQRWYERMVQRNRSTE